MFKILTEIKEDPDSALEFLMWSPLIIISIFAYWGPRWVLCKILKIDKEFLEE